MLHLACMYGFRDIAEYLIFSAGADIYLPSKVNPYSMLLSVRLVY